MIEINGRKIGNGYSPYFIAEISGNHNGEKQHALDLISKAKQANADAVKIQTFTPDCLTLNSNKEEFVIKSGFWKGENLYQLYKKTMTPFEWHEDLFNHAREIDITLFSSPFSLKSFDFLKCFNPPVYKIASNEAHDFNLIENIAKEQKPIIISSGVSTIDNLKDAVNVIKNVGNDKIIILYCVSQYPTPISDANLSTLIDLKEQFNLDIGLSDHSLGHRVSNVATALGACVIEKHFTTNRNNGGPDDAFSMEPDEFREMTEVCAESFEALGNVSYPTIEQLSSRSIFTRQLWSNADIKQGDELNWDNVQSIRAPSTSDGLSSREFNKVIGARAKQNIEKHSPITKEDIGQ